MTVLQLANKAHTADKCHVVTYVVLSGPPLRVHARPTVVLHRNCPTASHRASSTRVGWFTLLQVICMDNFFTGSKDNIQHLLGKPNFELIRHDVVEPILLEVDQVYHLACPASPIHYK